MNELDLSPSRWLMAGYLLFWVGSTVGAAFPTIFCVQGILANETDFDCWYGAMVCGAGIVVFGWVSLIVLRKWILNRRPYLALSSRGIFHREVHKDVIEWEVIEEILLIELPKGPEVRLKVPPEFAPSEHHGRHAQFSATRAQAVGYQEIDLPLLPIVPISAPTLFKWAMRLKIATPTERAQLLLQLYHNKSGS